MTIEVTAPASATRVALYISVGQSTKTNIAPAGFQFLLPTTAWPRDEYSALDVRDVSEGDEVAFELSRRTGEETKLTVAIVVALAADGHAIAATKLNDLPIPTDHIDRHVVDLQPVGTGELDVSTWGPESEPAPAHTCVVYDDHVASTIDMVVTETDPDCDGITAPDVECAQNKYMAVVTPVTQSSCLVESTITGTDGAPQTICELGGPACTDGAGLDQSCTSSHTCVPHSVCTACANNYACVADFLGLLQDAFPARINCRVGRVTGNNMLCGDEMVANLANVALGHACFGAPQITRGAGWSNKVSGGTAGGGQINIEVKSLQANCDFTVKITGMLPTTTANATGPLLSGLVAGALDNGRNVAIPVSVSFDPTVPCGTPLACSFVPGPAGLPDNIFDCANAPL